jgi:hypothetical protein
MEAEVGWAEIVLPITVSYRLESQTLLFAETLTEKPLMTVDELLEYVFNQSDLISPMLSRWVKSSERFKAFVERYRRKIRGKFIELQRDPEPREKFKDVLFELEIAYLMLKDIRFSEVEYQFYGDGPDFTVTDATGIVFNVEVKRIRKSREEKRLERWRGQVAREIRVVPSSLAIAINIGMYVDELNALLSLLDRLEDKMSDLIDYIIKTIHAEETNVPVDGMIQYPVPSFEGEVELQLRKPSGKPTADYTGFYGGVLPLFITEREWEQFKDLVFPKRDQRTPGMINLLAINTDSATHDEYALMEEIEQDFEERVACGNVTEQMKKLSGILFKGAWGNLFWPNTEIAYCPIPEDIVRALEGVGG